LVLAAFAWIRLAAAQPIQSPAMPASIGPTPIRFYSGNLSVGFFRNHWGTGKAGHDDAVSPQMIELLKRCSCQAMCDYIGWCTTEREPDRWDFSFHRRNADLLNAAGLQYNVFCWLHFPPKWYLESDRFVGYRDLATGETIPQLSLWSPETLEIFDEFYARLAAELGPQIAFLRLAMPSEYGEIGYCTGMTRWLVPQADARPAFWCGDRHARQEFAASKLRQYGSVAAINAAWGTAFQSPADIAMPDVTRAADEARSSVQARNRWLDFMDWYNQAWTDFMTRAVEVVRRHFPEQELIVSLGYGAERACYGNDQGRHIRRMADLKVAAQAPGAIGYFATRRVSSACRVYGVPYYTEPPGNVPRDQQVLRIWMDASNATQTWFDYPQNLDASRDHFLRYKRFLTGASPECRLALWLPTYHQYLNPNEPWPAALLETADALRDLCDYEVVDDHLLADDALGKLDVRVLALIQADCVSHAAVKSIHAWVESGGILLSLADSAGAVRGGADGEWRSLLGEPRSPKDFMRIRLDGPVPPAYRFSVTESTSRPYLIGQWFDPEGSGTGAFRWCGTDAGLRLPVEAGQAYRVQLAVGVPGAAGKAQLRIGDHVLRELRPGDTSVSFEVPAQFTVGRNHIDLMIRGNTWRPREVEGSDDIRELLIHLGDVQVVQAAGRPAEIHAPPGLGGEWDYGRIWRECGRSRGNGRVLALAGRGITPAERADLIAHFHHHLDDYGDYPAVIQVDGQRDGVWATAFAGHVLFYNSTNQLVQVRPPSHAASREVQSARQTTFPIKPGEIRSAPISWRSGERRGG
jgi:hypothetical protein